MECVHYVESGMHSAGGETMWKCTQTCIQIPNMSYHFLAKFMADIANQPLKYFPLSLDAASKSFSAGHSREPLLTEQSSYIR